MPYAAPEISYRTVGVWGAGIGRNLHPDEFDMNFYNMTVAIQYLVDNPPVPVEILNITATGNVATVHMVGGATYTFTLPIAEFSDRGAWEPDTDYVYGDIFTQGTGLYMVLREHTSDSVFLPDATGVGGPLYRLLFDGSSVSMTFLDDGYPVDGTTLHVFDVFAVDDLGVYMVLQEHDAVNPFDPAAVGVDTNPLYKKIFSAIQTAIARIQFQYPGNFPSDGSVMLKLIQDDPRDLTFAANLPDCIGHLEVAVTATLVFTLRYGGDDIGTLTFEPGELLDGDGGQFGTFAGDGATIANGELLRMVSDDVADATAKYLTVALVGSYAA